MTKGPPRIREKTKEELKIELKNLQNEMLNVKNSGK
jgi:ribosomal protein L29